MVAAPRKVRRSPLARQLAERSTLSTQLTTTTRPQTTHRHFTPTSTPPAPPRTMLVPAPLHYLYTHLYRRRLSTPQPALTTHHPPRPTSRIYEPPLTRLRPPLTPTVPPFMTLVLTCTCYPTNSANSVLINVSEIRPIKTRPRTSPYNLNPTPARNPPRTTHRAPNSAPAFASSLKPKERRLMR